jgi:hypothetical protein
MDEHDLRLDGNAAAGALQELFGFEVTAARGRCDACGAVEPIGALVLYAHAPGMVLRCAHCDAVMIRLVEAPDGYRVDLRGIGCLEITG